jgi:hypothetical protein
MVPQVKARAFAALARTGDDVHLSAVALLALDWLVDDALPLMRAALRSSRRVVVTTGPAISPPSGSPGATASSRRRTATARRVPRRSPMTAPSRPKPLGFRRDYHFRDYPDDFGANEPDCDPSVSPVRAPGLESSPVPAAAARALTRPRR